MKALALPSFFAPPANSAPTPARPGSGVRHFLRVLHGVNPLLSGAGWLNVPLIALALLLLPFDERTVTGLNVWFKPLKFALSGLLYLWTLAWLLADLPAPAQRAVRRLSAGVALSLTIEILIIYLQAARGTTSHYNVGSALDGALFGLMGFFIMVNTTLVVWALILTLRHRPFGPAAYVWGMRLGLLLFLVGSALGGAMIQHLGHTVGAADGGPGLPVLGWSTRAGDLRAAHFLGLHALQALPLVGWLLSRSAPKLKVRGQVAGLLAFTLLYCGAVAWLYWHAMQGLPFWKLQ
ncbi:hypothetical protein SAMN02745146_3539 [Hymenobacter daecheongensis DSM 21074]|uniref:Uncharacterized protein n=1 Tax=Hymenobacter daecheongensis DSM 21074 TaxID=1121955 RepID=A0A1M6KRK9_9BACT|nr:hypothetical protein [Hymenobacter daecheongensis]SHJ61562.1 hypothetical protein SAMN02745146_3539 [Hymenobacter daecheongensis DSM 21074]